jgi:hypothetical protein
MVRAMVAEPEIEIVYSHLEKQGKDTYAIVDIRNIGKASALYSGYSQGSPLSEVAHKGASGNWQNPIGKCGLGLNDYFLLPGEQVRTTNYIYGAGVWRVRLDYTKPTFRDRLPRDMQRFLSFIPRSYGPVREAWTSERPAIRTDLAIATIEGSFE